MNLPMNRKSSKTVVHSQYSIKRRATSDDVDSLIKRTSHLKEESDEDEVGEYFDSPSKLISEFPPTNLTPIKQNEDEDDFKTPEGVKFLSPFDHRQGDPISNLLNEEITDFSDRENVLTARGKSR